MLEYDNIDLSEGIDVNKTNGLRECIICRYRYLIEISFKFQSKVCNCCHNLMQKAMSFNDTAIASAKGNDYRIHFSYMNKDEAITFLKNAGYAEKSKKT